VIAELEGIFMKNYPKIILTLFILLSISNIGHATEPEHKGYITAYPGLNLRTESSLQAKVICSIPLGAEVIIKEKKTIANSSWARISWQDQTGWVAALYLSTAKIDRSLWLKIEGLRKKSSAIEVDPLELFSAAIEPQLLNSLSLQFELARIAAFETDNFENIDYLVKKCQPFYKIFIGGEANRIEPNIMLFLNYSRPKSLEAEFFTLAKGGYLDLQKTLHFGVANTPAWINSNDDSIKPGVVKEYFKKWKELKPRLSGIYKQIAVNTIEYLEDLK